jgi:hypothetical protein
MLAFSVAAAWSAEPATPALSRVVAGELTRVDLGRRSVSVKPDARDAARGESGDARELEAAVGPETRFVSRGRAVRLEDLRPGDRVVLVVSDEGGRRLARVVKVVGRTALPAPSPANSNPPATSASSG